MILSQYLHDDIVDVLLTFGNLNDVVNKILDEVDEGNIELENKPECRLRGDAKRYNIEIYNESYIQALLVHGVRSKTISLRRLIYWFVENEIYVDLGWEPVREYVDREKEKINKCVNEIVNAMDKLLFYCSNKTDVISHAKDLILSIKGE